MANFFKAKTNKPASPQVKDILTVNIDKLDSHGCGVAYYRKKPVFISGSLPNESVDIRLVEQKNKYARGKLLSVNKASTSRVEAKCQHFSVCGGCDLQHLEYTEQLNFKHSKVSSLFSRSDIDAKIVQHLPWQAPIKSAPWHYRRKARIGVQFDKLAKATIGFRQKATNQLVAVKSCPVLVEAAADIFPLLSTLIDRLTVKKAIGHIEVLYADDAEYMLGNQGGANSAKKLVLLVRQIRAINDHDRQIWHEYAVKHHWQVCFQESDQNEETALSYNTKNQLSYPLIENINIRFSSDDFVQINQAVNVAMVEQALNWLMPEANDHVLDLFCGLGNFSLPLASKVSKVIGVEGVQQMVDKASANAAYNKLDNCRFFQADLNSQWLAAESLHPWVNNHFTKVLLDPARAGAEIAVEQIAKMAIPTVLYVSCEPSTLARDCQILLSQGYKIEKIGLIDMFSQTKHVETMVLLKRLHSSK
ncbi:23S rRNA (uracil(1939)-C(5))-methyltransferase RlmD [Colwellia sp. KU-HH00111]|uniref:23S rRNA (uracil(1939)-C(5))-methyltransferase RlmD n=1 Tax=Colwellia sp. KU-HH00111 TaxID=3127652 RepID=UPI0031090567